MDEWDEFVRYVEEALSSLSDRLFLQAHPLTKLLAPLGSQLSAVSLHGLLLETIEDLKPLEPTPARSVAWRRYQYLRLRYLAGMGHEQIAGELAVSVRQARRDHAEGVRAAASLLWDRVPRREAAADETHRAALAPGLARPRMDQLDAELGNVASDTAEESVDLETALVGAVELTAPLALNRGVEVVVEPHRDLPSVAVSRVVLRQALVGLLRYLVDLTERGQIRASLVPANSEGAVELLLRCERTDPGGEVAPTEEKPPLGTVRRLAESQGISVDVSVEPDGCMAARLAFPATRPRTVLVIDDNPDVGWLFGRYVEGTRYRVVTARTGARALALAHELRPDAILLDLMLPTQDGWEILQTLKSSGDTRAIPVIVCSVLPERSVAMSLGVVDFLDKPVSQAALLAALARCSSGRSEPGAHPDSP